MEKQALTTHIQTPQKGGHKPEFIAIAEPMMQTIAASGIPFEMMAEGGSIQKQSARLRNAQFRTIQRQALALQIGRKQGNRHLYRTVTPLRGETLSESRGAPPNSLFSSVQRAVSEPSTKSTTKVIQTPANLRDPNRKFKIFGSVSPDAVLTKKLKSKGNIFHAPDVKEVTILETRRLKNGKYSHIMWDDGEGWTLTKNITVITIPKDTTVIEEENVGQYTKVRWGDKEGWIAKSQIKEQTFDLTYATTYSEGKEGPTGKEKELTGLKDIKRPYQEKAKEGFVSAGEISGIVPRLGQINNDNAYKRDPETGKSLVSEKLAKGSFVLLLETRLYKQHKNKKPLMLYRVIDSSGEECYTLGNINFIKKHKVEYKKVLDKFTLGKARATLEALYGNKVGTLIEKKKLTMSQQELVKTAKEFVKDSVLQSKYPNLQIPKEKTEEDKIKLSEDLIGRLNLFYKFLTHANLIDGLVPGSGISGVRGYPTAHKLATRWTLNPNNRYLAKFNEKIEFAHKLIDIDGKDPTANVVWATNEQVTRLKEFTEQYDNVSVTSNDISKKSQKKSKQEAKQKIEQIVQTIQKQQGTQTATACEGYPKGDPNTRPNIRWNGISLHCGGEAIDISFNYYFNFYDPIIDVLALVFGLWRPVKDYAGSPEYWHYERIGAPISQRVPEKQEE